MSNCAQRCTWTDSREPWEQEYFPPNEATRCRSLWPHGQSLIRISYIQNTSATFCRKIKSRFPPQGGPRRSFYRTSHLNFSVVNWDLVDYDRNPSSSMEMDKTLLPYTWIFWLCNKNHIFFSKVKSCNKRSWTSGRKTVHLTKLPAVTLHSGR